MFMCTETLAFYRLEYDSAADKDVYKRVAIIQGASWYSKLIATAEEKGLRVALLAKIRIPAENLPEGFVPVNGDLVIRGEGPWADSTDDLKNYGVVQTVGDNLRGRFPHLAVTAI